MAIASIGLVVTRAPPTAPPAPGAAAATRFEAGVHWHDVEPPDESGGHAPDAAPGTAIPVAYVFSYAARGALEFEVALRRWSAQLPADVVLTRVAAPLDATWRRHARNYYALEVSGADASVHVRMFEAVAAEPRPLLTPDGVVERLLPDGTGTAFRTAFDSGDVLRKLDSAQRFVRAWQIPSVPALLIDNRHLVLLADVGSQQALAVVDQLLAEARAQRAPGSTADLSSSVSR